MDYEEVEALNQSTVKLILSNQLTKAKKARDTEGFMLGNMVDSLVTGSEYNYIVCEEKIPDSLDSIFHTLLENRIADDIEKNKELILQLANQFEYCMKMGEEVRIDRIIKACKPLWDKSIEANGKLLIPQDLHTSAVLMSEMLKNHPFTKDIINNPDNEFQKELYFEYNDTPCKGRLDILAPDIIYDVKVITKGSVHNFMKSYNRFRYSIQSAFYTIGAETLYNCEFEFKFIAVSPFSNYPLIFNVSSDIIEKEIPKIEEAIVKYNWHQENGWETPMDVVLSNGNVEIGIDDISYKFDD